MNLFVMKSCSGAIHILPHGGLVAARCSSTPEAYYILYQQIHPLSRSYRFGCWENPACEPSVPSSSQTLQELLYLTLLLAACRKLSQSPSQRFINWCGVSLSGVIPSMLQQCSNVLSMFTSSFISLLLG